LTPVSHSMGSRVETETRRFLKLWVTSGFATCPQPPPHRDLQAEARQLRRRPRRQATHDGVVVVCVLAKCPFVKTFSFCFFISHRRSSRWARERSLSTSATPATSGYPCGVRVQQTRNAGRETCGVLCDGGSDRRRTSRRKKPKTLTGILSTQRPIKTSLSLFSRRARRTSTAA
jgi:hypothetical protein